MPGPTFTVTMNAQMQGLTSAFSSIKQDFRSLSRDVTSFANRATSELDKVTNAAARLSSALGGIAMPAAGGAAAMAPGVGGVAAARAGGGGGGPLSALEGISGGGGVLGTIVGATVGVAMRLASEGISLATQYGIQRMVSQGMPGAGAFAPGAGAGYGMNMTEWTRFVHGIRQPLAPILGPTGAFAGGGGLPEDLMMRIRDATGAAPEEIAGIFAQLTRVGGRMARGGVGRDYAGGRMAPPLEVLAAVTGLVDAELPSGLKAFNYSVHEAANLLQMLGGVITAHTSVYDRLNPAMLDWAAQAAGFFANMGMADVAIERVLTRGIAGIMQPGGGEAGRAAVYQAMGYRLGMDPFQVGLMLERDPVRGLQRLHESLGAQGIPVSRRMEALRQILPGLSHTDAFNLYQLMEAQDTEGMREYWAAFQAARPTTAEEGFGGVAVGGRGAGIAAAVARFENALISFGTRLAGIVDALYGIQHWALEMTQRTVNTMLTSAGRPPVNFGDPVGTGGLEDIPVDAGIPGTPEDLNVEVDSSGNVSVRDDQGNVIRRFNVYEEAEGVLSEVPGVITEQQELPSLGTGVQPSVGPEGWSGATRTESGRSITVGVDSRGEFIEIDGERYRGIERERIMEDFMRGGPAPTGGTTTPTGGGAPVPQGEIEGGETSGLLERQINLLEESNAQQAIIITKLSDIGINTRESVPTGSFRRGNVPV